MIPRNLEERHILEAVSHIDSKGVPWQRRSVHYHVVIDGKCYPPKYFISLSNLYASGIEHSSYDFNAIEAKNYFLARGYRIVDRRKTVVIPLVSEDDKLEYLEGSERFRRHRSLERNHTIAKKAKEKRLADAGKLQCDVCSFDFMETYGQLGGGFIEAHHTIPVSELLAKAKT